MLKIEFKLSSYLNFQYLRHIIVRYLCPKSVVSLVGSSKQRTTLGPIGSDGEGLATIDVDYLPSYEAALKMLEDQKLQFVNEGLPNVPHKTSQMDQP